MDQSHSGDPPLVVDVYPKISKRSSGPRSDRFFKSEQHKKALETGKFTTVQKHKPKLMPRLETLGSREGQSITLTS